MADSASMSRPSAILEKARDLRHSGNHFFRQQVEYQGALHCYTQAIDLLLDTNFEKDPALREEAVLNYCNRSACYLVLEDFQAAADDALYAWETLSEKTSAKAAYRLAKAYFSLNEDAKAKELIRFVLPSAGQEATGDEAKSSSFQLTAEEFKSFQELWNQVLRYKLSDKNTETTIQFAKRPISIREFTKLDEIGFGNFSEIRIVQHKQTHEKFALKLIAKKQCKDLAKRQHPNVYNEVQMERRVLLERLPPTSPFVIRMFHAFQDYEHIYYLMELHEGRDLWSELRWKKDPAYMVGCHRSCAKLWLYQLVLALEHLHRHGIVHRDIKAENILLNKRGHLVLIDFGTAKDLILEDLNGPEFVGTPDFMPPEAVTGDASTSPVPLERADSESQKYGPATWCADLWAMGALGYILQTGITPFWTTSPYLAFLRIQRGLLTRPVGIVDDDCWDWIKQLLQIHPKDRLGSDTFTRVPIDDNPESDKKDDGEDESPKWKIVERDSERNGYKDIKEHPYLAEIHQRYTGSSEYRRTNPIPALRDLCYRAVADMAVADFQDLDLCEAHPPGDGSMHDLTRLDGRDRKAVLHLLDRQKLLGREPRLWSRFFVDASKARLEARVRSETRDVVGLTQMNDDQGKAPQAVVEQAQFGDSDKKIELMDFVQICSPLLMEQSDLPTDEEEAAALNKKRVKLFRKCIARINKVRPKLVVVSSYVSIDSSCRKLLARINESIPVVVHQPVEGEPSSFYSFWLTGIQGLCLSYPLATSKEQTDLQKQQVDYMREQLDLARMSKHPFFCFINGPVHDGNFPLHVLKKLARGHTLCIFGPQASVAEDCKKKRPGIKLKYHANERLPKDASWSGEIDLEPRKDESKNNDDISVKSSDSVEDAADEFTTIIESTDSLETGLRWIRVDPVHADEWSHTMEFMTLDT